MISLMPLLENSGGYQIIQHQEEDRSPLLAEDLPDMKTTQR